MSEKPPGSFGWFGGASDSNRLAADPVGYVKAKTEKHGEVYCSKIAGMPCVFAGGYSTAKKMLEDEASYPPDASMLEKIKKCVGETFLMSDNAEGVQFWRSAVVKSFAEVNTVDGDVEKTVHQRIKNMIAMKKIPNFYKSAKEHSNSILFHLILGTSLKEAQAINLPALQTQQFRGCEALPVEGVPFVESTFEKGIAARKEMTTLITTHLKEGRTGPIAKAMLANCKGKLYREVGEHLTFLLHGIVPKALSSAMFYTWKRLTRAEAKRIENEEGYLRIFIVEALRLRPPVGVMGRGVKTQKINQYALNPKHGEWKAFPGIASANTDKIFGPTKDAFDPSRWTGPTPPPPPLTFGAGSRACPGENLTISILETSVKTLLELKVLPVFTPEEDLREKTLPVLRPTVDVSCDFVPY
eukprot:TRINITY_DN12710_c0_g1_i1.p1 TRINITY_DN12710_c0_g1~~TRINITY_DN12710_c0_g1_i1.p1  ORF type:complete len:435 (+),score=95.61 TRINITY_DN12710_c0_g1_i1:69-1307(+)